MAEEYDYCELEKGHFIVMRRAFGEHWKAMSRDDVEWAKALVNMLRQRDKDGLEARKNARIGRSVG